MKVHQLQVGNMQNFTYIVEDEDTSEAILIDPSWELVELELIIKKNDLKRFRRFFQKMIQNMKNLLIILLITITSTFGHEDGLVPSTKVTIEVNENFFNKMMYCLKFSSLKFFKMMYCLKFSKLK